MPVSEAAMDAVLSGSVVEMARLLAAGALSSEELTRAVLARIEAVNPVLNAMMAMDAERALDTARAFDRRRARGEDVGPLGGIPMTVKDSFETAGIVSTAGTMGRRTFVPERDAAVVARLKRAGAIVVGKTSTPELTLRFATENHLIGRTNNPYDPARSPGGSSGGAAAMVAAAASPFDIGSDTGGSIRLPAHFCGIAGLKPTAGRVPRSGHVPHFEFPLVEAFTQIGPLARHVEDLALLYPIMAGADPDDPSTVPMPVVTAPDGIAGCRVAFFTDNGRTAPCPQTRATVIAAAKALASAGARVGERRPPGIERSADLWRTIFLADGGALVRRALDRFGTGEMHPLLGWTTQQAPLSALELQVALSAWQELRRDNLRFLAEDDLLVCPVNATPAPVHGDTGPIDYTYHVNLLGWPAAVVRCGTSAEGLPIGVQIAAKPWREDLCLAAAAVLENAFGGWRPPASDSIKP